MKKKGARKKKKKKKKKPRRVAVCDDPQKGSFSKKKTKPNPVKSPITPGVSAPKPLCPRFPPRGTSPPTLKTFLSKNDAPQFVFHASQPTGSF
jgi:hypothetical protein